MKSKLLIIIYMLFALIASSLDAKIINSVIAIVNNEIITRIDFEERLAQTKEQMRQIYHYDDARLNQEIEKAKPEILQLMIDEILFTQEAMRNNIQVPDEKIQDELDKIKNQYGSDKDFEQDLISAGYTLDSWKKEKREFLLRQTLIRQKFESEVRITDDEVRKFYDDNKDQFPKRSDSVKLKHILIKFNLTAEDKEKAKLKAENVLQQCLNGADFTEMAEKFSDDPTAKTGGNLDYFHPGTGKYPEIEDIASKLKPGEMSNLIETSSGFSIIKVNDVDQNTGAIKAQIIHVGIWPSPESERVAEAKINSILDELKNGAKFVDLVKKYSEDPNTKNNDGDWMDVSIDSMSPDLRAAFDSFSKYEISRSVKTPYGIHIFQIVERQELSSEEIEQLRNFLTEKRLSEKLAEYSEKLRNMAYIQILTES